MALSALKIKNATEGFYSDGQGLYLRVQTGGAKSWIYRYQLNGKRHEMGIGSLEFININKARAEALRLRVMLKEQKIDPLQARRLEESEKAVLTAGFKEKEEFKSNTFKKLAEEYIHSHRAGWKSAKHGDQWLATLTTYAFPVIGDKPVNEVGTDDVLEILQKIWTTKTETASRVRSRIELILDSAKALGKRHGENPATWSGHLENLLPKPSKVTKVRNHPALPFNQMPAFMVELKLVQGIGARALEFAILTAARSGEVRGAVWKEFDLMASVWVVPPERMKAEKEHRVPLSKEAIALVKALPRLESSQYLFPGERRGQKLSDMTLSAVTRRMNENKDPIPWVDTKNGAQVVPHGFRSSFRDWASDVSEHPGEMAEMALAHKVSDKVEAAYRRGTMFEKRRVMMQDWADWCTPSKSKGQTEQPANQIEQ